MAKKLTKLYKHMGTSTLSVFIIINHCLITQYYFPQTHPPKQIKKNIQKGSRNVM